MAFVRNASMLALRQICCRRARILARTALVLPTTLVVLLAGCAKTPPGVTGPGLHRLIVEMTVRGHINPDYFYYFAIDGSGSPTTGPLPVVAPPWGNGWSAGSVTHYVLYNISQPGGYGVYRIDDPKTLLASTYLGRPLDAQDPTGGSTLRFTVDLDALFPPGGPQPDRLNLNFINTDIVPRDPNYRGRKLVDALGVSGNDYITIPIRTNRVFTSADTGIPEPAGDVADPDLDIVSWSIEVRNG